MRVSLQGAHARRIPLSYEPIQRLARKTLQFVDEPESADVVLFGFSKDIRDELEKWDALRRARPDLQFVVLSEEPLWDSVWSGDFRQRRCAIERNGSRCDFTVLNHVTTRIYRFRSFPFFITTWDEYFIRLGNLFRRNASFSADFIRDTWRSAPYRQAYVAEKRLDPQFDVELPELEVFGLSAFRTRLAMKAGEDDVLRMGQGWSDVPRRQALPDWHLDKLVRLDQRAVFVSGIENTHHPDYVTEKIFDAFAVLGVPLYYAGPSHAVHRLLPSQAFLNLYGLSAKDAAARIATFRPDSDFVNRYRETQQLLADLFSAPDLLWAERERIVKAAETALRQVVLCE